MGAPKVTVREQDLSSFVKSDNDLGVAIAVPLKRGSLDPILVTNKQDFLDKCTPNGRIDINMSSSHHSALLLSKYTNNLLVVRPISDNAMSSNLLLPYGDTAYIPVSPGIKVNEEPTVPANAVAMFYAENPGKWGDDIKISLIGYKKEEVVDMQDNNANAGSSYFSLSEFETQQFFPDGYPVFVYGENLNIVSDQKFVIKNLSNKNGVNKVVLHDLSGKPVTITSSTAKTVTLIPADQYTKVPGTYCIRIHKGVNNDIVESFVVSMDSKSISVDGINNFIEDVLLGSIYIRVKTNQLYNNAPFFDFITPRPLLGGTDGSPVTTADYIKAINKVSNRKAYKVTIFDDGGYTSIPYHKNLFDICENRGDSVSILSMPYELQCNRHNTVLSQIDWINTVANYNSSYGSISSSHQLHYDEFNDRYIYIGSSVFTTINIIQCNANYQIWYPAAGNKRGKVNAIDCKLRYTEGEEDLLYNNRINPIMFEIGKGIKVNGQLTLLRGNSMLTHLHVRLILCRINPAIKEFLEDYLHDLNTDDVLDSIKTKLTSYFDSLVDQKAIRRYSLSVVASDYDRDNFKARVRIIICPVSSIDEIPVDLGITNNTVSLELAESLLA